MTNIETLNMLGMPSYTLPQQLAAFAVNWWRVSDAASHWEVSWSTAKRYILDHQQELGARRVCLVCGKGTQTPLCVPADTEYRPPMRGNPRMRDSEYQRELARRRWQNDANRCTQPTV